MVVHMSDEGRCRFNCRTAKEAAEAAWYAATHKFEDGRSVYDSFEEYWRHEGRHEQMARREGQR